MIRNSGFYGRATACLAAIACAFGLTAAHAGVVRPAPAKALSAGRAGLVVEVDPLPGESKAVESADRTLPPIRKTDLSRSTDGLVLQVLPDGSRRVDLQGRFRAYSVVAISADGVLRMACADDPAAALALAAAAAHAPAARAHRVAFGPGEE